MSGRRFASAPSRNALRPLPGRRAGARPSGFSAERRAGPVLTARARSSICDSRAKWLAVAASPRYEPSPQRRLRPVELGRCSGTSYGERQRRTAPDCSCGTPNPSACRRPARSPDTSITPAGPEVGPGKLLFARPDQFHGLSGGAGQPRRFERGLARMLAAVARPGIRERSRGCCLRANGRPPPARCARRRAAACRSRPSADRRSTPRRPRAAPAARGRCRRRCTWPRYSVVSPSVADCEAPAVAPELSPLLSSLPVRRAIARTEPLLGWLRCGLPLRFERGRARVGDCAVGAATPTKSPSCTTVTPGRDFAAGSIERFSVA